MRHFFLLRLAQLQFLLQVSQFRPLLPRDTACRGMGCPPEWRPETHANNGEKMTDMQLILERIERIESLVLSIVDKQRMQSHYGTEEFAKIVNRSDFTVREWCRHGRLNARKKGSGRGKYQS